MLIQTKNKCQLQIQTNQMSIQTPSKLQTHPITLKLKIHPTTLEQNTKIANIIFEQTPQHKNNRRLRLSQENLKIIQY